MAYKGNVQLTFIIDAPNDLVAEGDRLFATHAAWMEKTHYREGENALYVYNVSKAPVLSNPMDITSAPTNRTNFVLMEIYESDAGVLDHYAQAQASWEEFQNFVAWLEKCDVSIVSSAPIVHSLW
ncbi:hypothetical protein COU18_01875 [Candidatus Kaiserbacteria bacterium CG10_big_fil_rev_8_21_14_0_10_51_14]|uniref:ABM domain-containing protein n=1 Tax=Candidatus Kaiserbacteria bacterium CG10_big_fil_rev_8_21_14_0_10_51_14 TaxID=1974610 RepID=A0A2H0UBT9_9BACT|nr:MAG: hypothetical protein COU18_01875 [Candidatus Kaiserbacteria bacterium CG10_big_fil_rev_8_21_14_0_10_51_14]